MLQQRTADGYVFRVDLRLRPDPLVHAAGRAGGRRARLLRDRRPELGARGADQGPRRPPATSPRAEAFLAELTPFVWRRNLDFSAIADIQSIKRQIHVHKVDERLEAKGADVKLGHGGIREIEFYVQTQQLILGGRDPALRANRTVDGLAALAARRA